ncbi:MAG: hypothetical protein MJK14_03970 [Rivularia sp. ALOHA_DT_140]|nr:hypothetical protein [Rivularia sp. ALOHA_DT_140]
MQLLKEPQTNTKKIPRWFAKFVLYQTQNGVNQQILLELLEPMSPEEWCITWIPILHPGIEVPTPGKRSPHGYMKACNATLSYLTGYNERTIEGWFYSRSYHYSVGILLRRFDMILRLQ